MANMSVYVTDELQEAVRKYPEINASKVCKEALQAEVDRIEAAAVGMDTVVIEVDGYPQDKVAFRGQLVLADEVYKCYVGRKGGIAMYQHKQNILNTFRTIEEFKDYGYPEKFNVAVEGRTDPTTGIHHLDL